jgi:putative salt-induced outer membrane protein
MLLLLATLATAPAADTLKFTADAGFVQTAGNTEVTTINVGNTLTLVSSGWTFGQQFSAIAGRSEGETTTSLWRGSLRGDRALGPRLALYALSEFDRNRFAGISSRYGISGGLAFTAVDTERATLAFEAGAGYVWQNVVAPGESTAFSAGRGAVRFAHALGEKAAFTQLVEVLPNFTAGDDLRIHSETSVSAPIATGIAMKASYVIRHDGLPQPGFETTDRILTTGVQVTF